MHQASPYPHTNELKITSKTSPTMPMKLGCGDVPTEGRNTQVASGSEKKSISPKKGNTSHSEACGEITPLRESNRAMTQKLALTSVNLPPSDGGARNDLRGAS